jgi:hypothetical protein
MGCMELAGIGLFLPIDKDFPESGNRRLKPSGLRLGDMAEAIS